MLMETDEEREGLGASDRVIAGLAYQETWEKCYNLPHGRPDGHTSQIPLLWAAPVISLKRHLGTYPMTPQPSLTPVWLYELVFLLRGTLNGVNKLPLPSPALS